MLRLTSLGLCFSLLGCSSSPVNATSGSTSSSTGGGDACPLDANARATADAFLVAVVADSIWISTQSNGHGIGADRAFGASVPSTGFTFLAAATLNTACTGPMTFAKYCEMTEPGQPPP